MLSVSFHLTFIPERRLVTALLDYASKDQQGTIQEMAEVTGIPMGKSSGKMLAILDYARGMGLIELNEGKTIKKPALSKFGKVVYKEDRFLGEEIVQWIAHLNLCRGDKGAKTWHETFARGRSALGSIFSKQQLEEYLNVVCGQGKDRTGPLVTTYLDDAALKRAGALSLLDNELVRKKAPLLEAYAKPYSAYLLSLLDIYFPEQVQIALTDFQEKTLWFDICLWNENDINLFFSLLERKGYISVDRQRKPWIIERLKSTHDVWSHFFDDIA